MRLPTLTTRTAAVTLPTRSRTSGAHAAADPLPLNRSLVGPELRRTDIPGSIGSPWPLHDGQADLTAARNGRSPQPDEAPLVSCYTRELHIDRE